MSELEADLAAIEGLERAIGQRQFYRLFPDQDMALPDGSVRLIFECASGACNDRYIPLPFQPARQTRWPSLSAASAWPKPIAVIGW